MPDPTTGLSGHVAAALRDRIIGGALTPGQRLSEMRLAAEMDVSRNTLREAFRLLTADGLLDHKPHRGVFVATPSLGAILDIYRVRRLIEVPTLARAVPGHPAAGRMRAAVDLGAVCRDAGDWRGVGSANMEFHAAIVALGDSPRLSEFFARVIAELRLAFGLLGSPEALHAPYLDRNREILRLLDAAEPLRAADALSDYLDLSELALTTSFARFSEG